LIDTESARPDVNETLGYMTGEQWHFENSDVTRVDTILKNLQTLSLPLPETEILSHVLEFVSANCKIADEGRQIAQELAKKAETAKARTLPNSEENNDESAYHNNRAAIADLEKHLKNGHDSYDLRTRLGSLFVAIGKPQASLLHFIAAAKLNPNNPDPVLRIAEQLIAVDRRDQAKVLLKGASQRFTTSVFRKKADILIKMINNGSS